MSHNKPVALIAGASTGIGRAATVALAASASKGSSHARNRPLTVSSPHSPNTWDPGNVSAKPYHRVNICWGRSIARRFPARSKSTLVRTIKPLSSRTSLS